MAAGAGMAFPKRVAPNRKRSVQDRLGHLIVPATGVQAAQMVQRWRDTHVIRAKCSFLDDQSSIQQGLGLLELLKPHLHDGQIRHG